MNDLITMEELKKYLRTVILSSQSLEVREFALELLLKIEKLVK